MLEKALLPLLEGEDEEIAVETSRWFKAHPSREAMLASIRALPQFHRPVRWNDVLKCEIVAWYVFSCFKGNSKPPPGPWSGRDIQAWFEAHGREFDWPEEG